MKLNDPFGRMERRHQMAYATMCEAMRSGGIDTEQAAHELIQHARSRALKFLGIGTLLMLLVVLLVPKTMPLVLGLAVLLIVWTVNSTMNGRRYILRYIDEELKKKKE